MLDYVRRSVERSPAMMREPGDASNFLRQLGHRLVQCVVLAEHERDILERLFKKKGMRMRDKF